MLVEHPGRGWTSGFLIVAAAYAFDSEQTVRQIASKI